MKSLPVAKPSPSSLPLMTEFSFCDGSLCHCDCALAAACMLSIVVSFMFYQMLSLGSPMLSVAWLVRSRHDCAEERMNITGCMKGTSEKGDQVCKLV